MTPEQRPNLPNTLLRFFTTEEYARQFVAGSIRFGVLEYYRGIEDVRKDTTEGRSSVYFRADVPIHSTVTSLNRYYVLCASHPEVNVPRLASKYGRFVVSINDPLQLLDRIKAVWKNHDLAIDNGAFIASVEYSKDGLRDADPLLLSPPHLVYSQKPRLYEEDREYRYLLKCKVDVKREWETHLTLAISDCGDIFKTFYVPSEGEALPVERSQIAAAPSRARNSPARRHTAGGSGGFKSGSKGISSGGSGGGKRKKNPWKKKAGKK